ncbi:MAG: hypothetical protein ACRDRA_19570 [Pseudonocardiaceae bacterium]
MLGIAYGPYNTPGDYTPEQFGYNKKPLSGTRPLLTLLRSPNPDRGVADFQSLLFGPGTPNLDSLFRSVSQERFRFSNAGIYAVPRPDIPGEVEGQPLAASLQLAQQQGFDLSRYDVNGDRVVNENELTILWVYDARGGQTNYNDSCPWMGGQVCWKGFLAGMGEDGALDLYAHELLHSVSQNAIDNLYGAGCRSERLTLMSCSTWTGGPIDASDRVAYHLDPYYKMLVGWAKPAIAAMNTPGACASIRAPSAGWGYRPVLIPDPTNLNRFLMMEFRSATPAGGVANTDRDVAGGYGVAIWYYERNAEGNLAEVPAGGGDGRDGAGWSIGAPDGARGGTTLWRAEHGQFRIGPSRLTPLSAWAPLTMRVGPASPSSSVGEIDWWPTGLQHRWRIDTADSVVARGGQLQLSGLLGMLRSNTRARLINDAGVSHELPVITWSCGKATVTVPSNVPPGSYYLSIAETSTADGSNRLRILVS